TYVQFEIFRAFSCVVKGPSISSSNFSFDFQLWECLEERKQFNFIERDHASRLDLIAKVRGLKEAEDYISKIPASFRKEIVYRTLLSHYVSVSDVKKAEKIFNKMRDWGFPLSSFTCDQLLLLYSRTARNKIVSVLSLMVRENVKLSQRTYSTLIDAKGRSGNREGMEKVVMTMKADGIEPDSVTKSILAKHYALFGLKPPAGL
ncbi:pentatricopeptide repeat-containing protein At1g15480, mitochondrial-like, partial [Punica granatum]|uniref:Pentatricopeptide repeat-containing protein At1g15480, mitochondrial-like n=1 Tax=Punica granatum TaxID=22663 RepID=A0A6P8CBZ4_PUNGR